jgi:hypothetical protein
VGISNCRQWVVLVVVEHSGWSCRAWVETRLCPASRMAGDTAMPDWSHRVRTRGRAAPAGASSSTCRSGNHWSGGSTDDHGAGAAAHRW